jgi:hypothetical protein
MQVLGGTNTSQIDFLRHNSHKRIDMLHGWGMEYAKERKYIY